MAMSGESSSLIELGVVGRRSASVVGSSYVRSRIRRIVYCSIAICNCVSAVRGWTTELRPAGAAAGSSRRSCRASTIAIRRESCAAHRLACPRAELPQRDDKDFYRADLIGCEVVNLAGRYLGKVQHFVETPAQVLMVVRGSDAAPGEATPGEKESRGVAGEKEYWVPAVPRHLRRVDLQARRVVVDWDDAAG